MPPNRSARIIASGAGTFLLIGLVTVGVWRLEVEDIVSIAIGANVLAMLLAFSAWSGVIFEGKNSVRRPGPESWQDWLVMFVLGAFLSAFFLLLDCNGHLPSALGGTACDRQPGLDVIFTVAAVAITAISLPSALRAWLLAKLSPPSGEG